MLAEHSNQISLEILNILGYKDSCAKTYNTLSMFLKWTDQDHYKIPPEIKFNGQIIAVNRFVYEGRLIGADDGPSPIKDTVELKRFIRPYSPSVPFPEDLYHRWAGSTRFHFFSSSWLENLARQEDFIIDAISRSPEKICILAKVTGYNLNDYAGEKLSYVKPLIIIPSADIIKSKFDDITQSKLRDWEDRFLIDRRT